MRLGMVGRGSARYALWRGAVGSGSARQGAVRYFVASNKERSVIFTRSLFYRIRT